MEDRSLDESLLDELSTCFEALEELELGSDKYNKAVQGISVLSDKVIEIDKLRIETELKEQQIKNEERNNKIKNGIAIGGLVIPTAVTIWGTFKTMKFEETGSATTTMGRGFFNQLTKLFKK